MRKRKRISGVCMTLLIVFCFMASASAGVSAKQFLPEPGSPAFAPAFPSLDEAKRAGNVLNNRIAAEGIILMKNESGALPLAAAERRVTVFAKTVSNGSSGATSEETTILTGGGGSGSGAPVNEITFLEAMEDAGFAVNTNTAQSACVNYSDVAFIIIARKGSESGDQKIAANGDHPLDPDSTELGHLQSALEMQDAQGGPLFKKIILLLSLGNVFEIKQYVDNERVQAVLYIGYTGSQGIVALPGILTGEVNPSGRTVDVWPAELEQDPSWFNVLTNTHFTNGTTQNVGIGPGSTGALAGSIRSLDYEEGIYSGYKWYETAATIEGYYNTDSEYKSEFAVDPDDPYYNRYNGVIYPFGYGLSYTSFSWTLGEPSFKGVITEARAGDRITLPVTVKNTGDTAGKDVVQAYVRAPYDETDAPVEKSDSSMIAFTKTKLLLPGEEQTVTLAFDVSDLASFDWDDRNVNGFKGYELEPGTYEVLVRPNSHEDVPNGEAAVKCSVGYTVLNEAAGGDGYTGGIQYSRDGFNEPLNYNKGHGEKTAEAVFSQNDKFNTARVGTMDGTNKITLADAVYTTRSDWKLPSPTINDPGDPNDAAELTYSQQAVDMIFSQVYYGAVNDLPTDPWYKTEADIPGYGTAGSVQGGWKQAPKGSDPNRECDIQLKDMAGIPLSDPLWVEFMNQLTWAEMTNLLTQCFYKTPAMPAIGKPVTYDVDGPAQLRDRRNTGKYGTFWCSSTLISSTYNVELCEEQGRHIGMEGMLITDSSGNVVNGWYGPGLNAHRSPFGGRNFEYYSQDGVQGGIIGGAVCKGATEMGMHIYGKHYVVNDQDTARNNSGGISVWCNEQALRENYLRHFEYAIEYGNMNGMMNSHGKLGLYATQNNFYLNSAIPRNEWGFEGVHVTDLVDGAPVAAGRTQMTNADLLIRGGSTFLGNLANQRRGEEPFFDGRILDGYYDAAANKLLVPASLEVKDWVLTGNVTDPSADPSGTAYSATVTPGAFTLSSPTQWYWIRTTAMNALFVAANSGQMISVDGADVAGAYVAVHYNDGVTPDETYMVSRGKAIAAPDKEPVIPQGKRFGGWFTNEECSEPMDFSKPVTGYTALYAFIADADRFAAHYDLNYTGAPSPGTIVIKKDEHAAAPPYTPYRQGYKFDGWYLDPDCDEPAEFINIPMVSDITFYAKWTPVKTYTVTFNRNYEWVFGETFAIVNEGAALGEPLFTPVRKGFVFGGWYRDSYCNSPAEFSDIITKDIVLYAKWTPAESASPSEPGGCSSSLASFGGGAAVIAALAAFAVIASKKSKKDRCG